MSWAMLLICKFYKIKHCFINSIRDIVDLCHWVGIPIKFRGSGSLLLCSVFVKPYMASRLELFLYVKTYFFFNLKGRVRDRGEALTIWLQWAGLGLSEARSQELPPGLLHELRNTMIYKPLARSRIRSGVTGTETGTGVGVGTTGGDLACYTTMWPLKMDFYRI